MAGARVTVLPTALLLFGDDWIHLLRTVRRTSQKVELNNLRFFCNKNNNTTFRGCSCWWLMNWNWSRCEGATSFISARSVHTDCSDRHCFKIRLRRGCINPGISNTIQNQFRLDLFIKIPMTWDSGTFGSTIYINMTKSSTLTPCECRQCFFRLPDPNMKNDILPKQCGPWGCMGYGSIQALCRYGLTKSKGKFWKPFGTIENVIELICYLTDNIISSIKCFHN